MAVLTHWMLEVAKNISKTQAILNVEEETETYDKLNFEKIKDVLSERNKRNDK